MKRDCKAFVVGGPASGVGKTTVALGLMAAFRRRGLAVQPFKCGPDFIDADHHTRICGRAARNLDGWMLPAETNQALFAAHASTAEVAIVEGVMGLFDGARNADAGSTAAMAKLLRLPIVLVVDGSKMAASAAALVRGFQDFDPAARVQGVIFNKLAGAGHYRLLRDALDDAGCAPALGYLPNDPGIHVPERHLGLHTAGEEFWSAGAVEHLAALVEEHLELDRLLSLAANLEPGEIEVVSASGAVAHPSIRVAIARDRAFSFYYEDNLDALRAGGAEIVEFSPLADRSLPQGTQAVYIGGGYPELYAAQLAANAPMRAAIREFGGRGAPIYAECGGLMYLASQLRLSDGSSFEMAGLFPFTTALTDRLVRFGYSEVCVVSDCLLGRAGTVARGHSYHYSTIEGEDPEVASVYRVHSTLSGAEWREGFTAGNVLASYIHLHFLSNPELVTSFLSAARDPQCRPQ